MSGEAGNLFKAGFAVLRNNPFVFGAVAIAAFLVSAYQIYKSTNEEELTYSSNRSHRNRDMYYYDPETRSVTNAGMPVSNPSDNNVRKRQVPKNTSSTTIKNRIEAPDAEETISKDVQTSPIDNDNANNDDNKILPDKSFDTSMTTEEKINEYFRRNISEIDSLDTVNDLSEKSEKKLNNDPTVYSCDTCESFSAENLDGTLDTSSSGLVSPSWSDNSVRSCDSFEQVYLEEVCRALNEDIGNMNETEVSRAPSVCSVGSFDSEISLGTILSGDSEFCRGCEQNPVNTHTLPCNHRYMCSDCAMRVFRLFKRCKICRAKIEQIVEE